MWAILRAPQSVWQGYATKCLPLSGISEVRLKVGQSVISGYFMCLPHGLSDMCMPKLGLLALKGYRSGVVDILLEHMYSIGWCIVGR